MADLGSVDHFNRFVQGGMLDGQFLNASYTIIAAGPPRLAQLGGVSGLQGSLEKKSNSIAFPIGIVQNLNLSQNRTINRIWEIGSERSYFIPGRTVQQLGLGRVYYHGPSLLRALYAYYDEGPSLAGERIPPVFINDGSSNVANAHDVIIPPGYDNIFLNLASDLFAQPIGLLLYFRDSNKATIGAVYLESCYVPSHTLATDSQGTIIQESCAVQFERIVPVRVSSVQLINTFKDIEVAGIPQHVAT